MQYLSCSCIIRDRKLQHRFWKYNLEILFWQNVMSASKFSSSMTIEIIVGFLSIRMRRNLCQGSLVKYYFRSDTQIKNFMFSSILFSLPDSVRMPSVRNAATLALVLLVLAEWSVAMPTADKDKDRLLNTVDVSKPA